MSTARITSHVYSVIMFLCLIAMFAITNVMWDSRIRVMHKTIVEQKAEIARLENVIMSHELIVIQPIPSEETNE